MRYLGMILIVAASLTGTSARAQWAAHVTGPDVFGNTKVVAVTNGFNEGLVVQCDQQDELIIAYIFRIKEFQTVNPQPAELWIQTNGGAPKKLPAMLGGWNDNFAGVSTQGRTKEVVDVVRAMGNANRKINIGIVVNDQRTSATFDSGGSTAAMGTVIKDCKLDKVEADKEGTETKTQ